MNSDGYEVVTNTETSRVGRIIPPCGRSREDSELDADGRLLEIVDMGSSEDESEWNRITDQFLTEANWRRTSDWTPVPNGAAGEIRATVVRTSSG